MDFNIMSGQLRYIKIVLLTLASPMWRNYFMGMWNQERLATFTFAAVIFPAAAHIRWDWNHEHMFLQHDSPHVNI